MSAKNNPEGSYASATQWFGLILGPVLCAFSLWALPTEFDRVGTGANASRAGAAEAPESVQPSAVDEPSPVSPQKIEFSWAGRATLGVMLWMGVWWMTEAIHISATALLPAAIFPVLGVASIQEACFPYADPLVFLYLGGFILALSMERWGLGRRIALLTLRVIGTSAKRMVVGFMLVTAVLSAFVSNTATTAMMLPIAMSVIALLRRQTTGGCNEMGPGSSRFGTCLLLAIAYSASVGGMMTIIGTPTNTFLIGFLRDKIAPEYRQDISFVGWLPIGVPLTALFLPLMYLALTRLLFPIGNVAIGGGKALIEAELAAMQRVQRGEWNTLIVFIVTVSLWLFRPLLTKLEIQIQGASYLPLSQLTDAGIAMVGALLLFLIPVRFKRLEFTMDWSTAERLPWGILLLFGGGLSLAAAVEANGVSEFIGSLTGSFASLSPLALVLIVTTGVVFLTELTSNAATTASLVPVLAALAPGLGVHPYLLAIPATLAASCAFMLPVATPPNAIVFGSGEITIPQMMRAGFVLNLISIVLVTTVTMLIIKPWLGV